MTWEAWYTLAVVTLVFVGMLRQIGPPDFLLLGALVLVTVAGIVEPAEALSGFANPGMLTVGALFIVAAALRETGALDRLGRAVLGPARTEPAAFVRLTPQVGLLSAFLNNTTVVAMLVSVVGDWCRRHRVSPSRLMLPLSYLAILGGMCTLIGTSTNLVVHGLMLQSPVFEGRGLSMFELAWVGLPALVVGTGYLWLVGRRLLPDRLDLLADFSKSTREYLANMRIEPHCPLVGQSVEAAGLRRLPGLFLVEIDRDTRVIAPVSPDEILEAGDRLTFTGAVDTIVDLERIPGLVSLAGEPSPPEPPTIGQERRYSEAVVSGTSPLVGTTIRDANFRARYNAVVIAVHRGGERLRGRVGDIEVRGGDTLLLQTGPHFAQAHRNNPDFYLVTSHDDARPVRHQHAALSLALLAALIVLLVTGWVSVVVAAFAVAGLMIATGCLSAAEARRAVQWNVLLTIASALGLGQALADSGAANVIASLVVSASGQLGPVAALAAVVIVTAVFTELITNNAAAVLVFPVALAVAGQLDLDPRPFAIAVAIAASASFATPIGYQTNLLVYGPGGYRFADFLRVGGPLSLLIIGLLLALVPFVWGL